MNTPQPSPLALLRQRRFAPFFWTQFAGAANDNLFKFAFTVMLTYQLSVSWLPPAMAGLAIGALFILPFVLFSATSGQLSDKYDKARMMRRVKSLEVLIMLLATAGLLAKGPWLDWQVPLLLVCTFLMGLHSTLFGPVKFAYLPQTLRESELMGGNGMVEMGTFVAILLGNVAGGLLVALPGDGPAYVAAACLALALAARGSAGAGSGGPRHPTAHGAGAAVGAGALAGGAQGAAALGCPGPVGSRPAGRSGLAAAAALGSASGGAPAGGPGGRRQ
jgi:MFS family permease